VAYDPFFRLKYLSNYHLYMTKQWPTEALHQFHLIELVNALRMGHTSSIFFTIFLLSPRLAGTTFLRANRLGTTHDADLSSWMGSSSNRWGGVLHVRASEDQEKRDQIGNGKGLIIINNQPF
jgi:hypothetical protein